MLAMPWMAQGNAHVTAAVANCVVNYDPLKAKMLAFGKNVVGSINSDRKAHGVVRIVALAKLGT